MGEVYEARDTRLGRSVAVKVLPSDLAADPDRRKRFEREARAVAALSHPNISTIFDVGREETPSGPVDYLVMELLEGETLAQRLRRGPLPIEQVLRAGIEITSALSKAHRAGVVHRDVKPGNIVLTKTGARLLDFGVARLRADDPCGRRSPSDQRAGHARRLADRRRPAGGDLSLHGSGAARRQGGGRRADLFALGAVLYDMATGRRAFDGESPARVTAAILTSQPPALTSLQPAAPPALERLVEQLLVKDPDGRMESAHDLGLRLRSIAEGLDDSAGLGAPAAQRKRRLVRRAGASLVALLVVALPVLAYLAAKQRWQRPIPSYQRVTFRRGVIWGSRFAPDGQSIVYGATWDGQPIRLYSTRLGSPESSPLSFPDADLLAVSSLGELAVSPRRFQWTFPIQPRDTGPRAHGRRSAAGGSRAGPTDEEVFRLIS
jgi:hypothetical protein